MSKEIYVPVGGVAQKVTKMYAPVNGVARSVKKAYKGVNGVARQFFSAFPPLDPVFANNSWENVIIACQKRIVPDTWVVGNNMTMNIGGRNYRVNIIGKNHDDYADGSGKAPLTFQLHECYNVIYNMNSESTNVGGWTSSLMRTANLPEIMALMPAEVQAGIREVNKLTSKGNASSVIEATADKLFLLSEAEIRNTISESFSGEGSRYEYYTRNSSVKYLSGAANSWWTRSPRNMFTTQFCNMTTANNASSGSSAGAWLGVVFAFCF